MYAFQITVQFERKTNFGKKTVSYHQHYITVEKSWYTHCVITITIVMIEWITREKKRLLSEKPIRILLESYIVFKITTYHETDICDTAMFIFTF